MPHSTRSAGSASRSRTLSATSDARRDISKDRSPVMATRSPTPMPSRISCCRTLDRATVVDLLPGGGEALPAVDQQHQIGQPLGRFDTGVLLGQ